MLSGKFKPLVLILSIIFSFQGFSQTEEMDGNGPEALHYSLDFLKKYFVSDTDWHVTDSELQRSVQGLIQFIEKQPVDSIQTVLQERLMADDYRFVYRLPEHVSDSLQVEGYYTSAQVRNDLERLNERLRKKYDEHEIHVPVSL